MNPEPPHQPAIAGACVGEQRWRCWTAGERDVSEQNAHGSMQENRLKEMVGHSEERQEMLGGGPLQPSMWELWMRHMNSRKEATSTICATKLASGHYALAAGNPEGRKGDTGTNPAEKSSREEMSSTGGRACVVGSRTCRGEPDRGSGGWSPRIPQGRRRTATTDIFGH